MYVFFGFVTGRAVTSLKPPIKWRLLEGWCREELRTVTPDRREECFE